MRTILRSALLLAVALIAAAQPPAAQPAAQTAEEKAKKQATLQGQVLNLVTGEPVRKANLSLEPEHGGTNLKAISDNAGKFSIENVNPGRYTLSADRQGVVQQNYRAPRPSGPGTTLDGKEAQEIKDLAFKLTPRGIITGRV